MKKLKMPVTPLKQKHKQLKWTRKMLRRKKLHPVHYKERQRPWKKNRLNDKQFQD